MQPELAVFQGPEGVGLGLTSVLGGVDYDLDGLVLRVADLGPERIGVEYSDRVWAP